MKRFLKVGPVKAAAMFIYAVTGGSAGAAGAIAAGEEIFIDVAYGKACWIEAYTNSGATWTMTVKNGDAVAAVFQGTGVNFTPMTVTQGSARFDVTGGVIATFASSSVKADVKVENSIVMSEGGQPAAFGTLIGGEDGSDDDWQDLLATFTCLHNAG